jgi:hypothetical protein
MMAKTQKLLSSPTQMQSCNSIYMNYNDLWERKYYSRIFYFLRNGYVVLLDL